MRNVEVDFETGEGNMISDLRIMNWLIRRFSNDARSTAGSCMVN
jgi:hypothetical protein